MFPASFDYHAPTTLDEALACLREHGAEAKLLAGGQSLVAAMNLGLARPGVVVDLNGVAGLDGVHEDGAWLRVGALVRQQALAASQQVRRACPLLAEAAALIGNARVRSRGTLGGSLAHADPASELPAVAVALGAELRVAGLRGTRAVAAGDFVLGPLTTALAEDELLVEVCLPARPPRSGWAFEEVARRPGDFAVVGVAAMVTLAADGRCMDARLAFAGVGAVPVRAVTAEAGVRGGQLTAALVEDAARMAADKLDVAGDALISADYRRHLARVLAARALQRAVERAGATGGSA
jgi:carbon-monoxide dehydrogenase medium subunit